MNIRPAYSTDADALAYLTNLASEGLSECIWEHLVEGDETPLLAGARLIRKEDGIFSYRNTTVQVQNNREVLALISGRHLMDTNLPVRLDEYLPFIRSLIKLEAKVRGSWNITALAVNPAHTRRGLATQLLEAVEQLAQTLSIEQLSIAIASENPEARRLVEDFGFETIASETFVRFGNLKHNGDWLMMVKSI